MLRFMSGKCKPVGLDFNVWDHPLPEIYGIILGMFIKLGLVECLNITESELLDFIIDVDRGYLATFYHSFYHAADVTAVLYHMLLEMNASQYLSKPDMAALLLAGLCHDIGHPGLNNLFQVNAKTELAAQYGETSVLEKYSCSLAMELVAKHQLFRNMEKSPVGILPEGNPATEESMKESMIKAIMATDMSFHYDMLNNLSTLIESMSTPTSTPSNSDTETESDTDPESVPVSPSQPQLQSKVTSTTEPPSALDAVIDPAAESNESLRTRFQCPIQHHRRQMSTSSTASDCSDTTVSSDGSTQATHSVDGSRSPSDLTPELRQSLCNCLLHAADISNAVKPWDLCKRWSDLVVQEFFRQGDIEKAQQLPISPNMDRDQHNQPQISLGFGDFVVKPYFESFVELLPEAAPFLANLKSNRVQWVALQKADLMAVKDTNVSIDTAVDVNEAIRRASSPLPPHLTTGRRVSVAAGVLVLDDSRPLRAPHRRLRHSTNAEASSGHGHAIRKIKRSLSGRSLSSCLRDLHVHPRSMQSSGKNTMTPIVSVLKREAALAGKKAGSSTGSIAPESTVSSPSSRFAQQQTLLSEDRQQQQQQSDDAVASGSGSSEPEHTAEGSQSPESPDSCVARFRQRRHGSLQLEDKYPSIRQELGDGYVQLDHQDTDGDDAEHIPTDDSVSGTSPSLSTDNDQSNSPPEQNRSQYGPALSSLPVSSRSSSSSSAPIIESGKNPGKFGPMGRRDDRPGFGPLDATHERVGIPLKSVVTEPGSFKADSLSAETNGPTGLSDSALGSVEGTTTRTDLSPSMVVAPEQGEEEDGPLSCVVGVSVVTDDNLKEKRKKSMNGTVSISAASAGPTPTL
ncbi:hypothetical protein BGX28_003759 [Mortierella sp. GBA30]|nr:hypothetical protein BGX28_003759 [Mortierella sp. GBA30]